MELWIRTQDRRHLLKVDNIDWFGGELYTNNRISLETTKDGKTYLLGTYHNGQRALEVLDEIQGVIHPKLICTGDYPSDITDQLMSDKCVGIFYDNTKMTFEQLEVYVYNMPKEKL